jgi:hypothetical protein
MTGLNIGKLTAIGSMVLICTPITLVLPQILSQLHPPSISARAGAFWIYTYSF